MNNINVSLTECATGFVALKRPNLIDSLGLLASSLRCHKSQIVLSPDISFRESSWLQKPYPFETDRSC